MANGEARQPRTLVKIDGLVAQGLVQAEVENNNFYSADTFRCVFAVQALNRTTLKDVFYLTSDLATSSGGIQVEVFFGFPKNPDSYTPADLQSFILGHVDEMVYDPVINTLTVSGRDLTSNFIDNKTTDKFPNKTVRQVVTLLAQKYSMTPIISATGNGLDKTVGAFLNNYQAQMGDARTEWDLLTWLSQQVIDANGDSFVVYVKGNELHFESRPISTNWPLICKQPVVPGQAFQAYTQDDSGRQHGIRDVSFSRNLSVLRNVVVEIRSPQHGKKKPIVASYPNQPKGVAPGTAVAKKQLYQYTVWGLTQEQALRRAQSMQQDISRHEVKMDLKMPADNILLPTSLINVSGTGTAFDQTYYPDSVHREYSLSGGYHMSLTAKNHSTNSQAIV